jgi:hypothetical protein
VIPPLHGWIKICIIKEQLLVVNMENWSSVYITLRWWNFGIGGISKEADVINTRAIEFGNSPPTAALRCLSS